MEGREFKEQLLMMAAQEVEMLLFIIGDMGYIGYRVFLCKLSGSSLRQCAIKFKITKRQVQCLVNKGNKNGYDIHLKRIFSL